MVSFGERCYSNQYDEISDDEISGFANTTKFPTTKFLATKFPPPTSSILLVRYRDVSCNVTTPVYMESMIGT